MYTALLLWIFLLKCFENSFLLADLYSSMCPRRRAVLAAIGSTAAFGGAIGYWQRRRIRRRNETDDINSALGIEFPPVDVPISISEGHLQYSYHRARDHVTETESLLDSADDMSPGTKLDRAWDELNTYPPESLVDGYDRIEALEAYRLAVAISGSARSRVHDDARGQPSDALQNAFHSLRNALDVVEPRYHGTSLSTVIVQCGEGDDLHSTAMSQANRAQDYLENNEFSNSVTWEIVETARQITHDANWLFEKQEGPDQTEALEDTFRRLTEQVEANTDDVIMDYEDGVRSQAEARSLALKSVTTEPETHFNKERLALAVREQARTAMVTATFDTLEQYPAIRELDGTEYRLIDDSEQLITQKRDTVEAVTTAINEVGGDPLGRYLLTETIETVDRADRQLNRLLDNVRSYDQKQWISGRDTAYLRFRSSAAEARAIPHIIKLVEG